MLAGGALIGNLQPVSKGMLFGCEIDLLHAGDYPLHVDIVANNILIGATAGTRVGRRTGRYCQRAVENVEIAEETPHLIDIADMAVQFATKPNAAGVHIG